jgi:hypothetical protein
LAEALDAGEDVLGGLGQMNGFGLSFVAVM